MTQDALTARGGRVRWAIALACLVFVMAPTAPASAQWRPILRSCAAFAATPGCTTLANFGGAWNVVVSPDGKHAYATAWDTGAIHVFDRNTATGALTEKAAPNGCLTQGVIAGCTTVRAIADADDILISANGKNVYVTGWGSSIAIFDRNTTTGVLVQKAGTDGCINNDGTQGCFDGRSVGGIGAVLSGDQKNIYELGGVTLAVFDRNTTTGVLTQKAGAAGCFGAAPADGCTPTTADPSGRQLAISGDGKNLYTPTSASGVLVFDRNTADGALTLKPTTQGCLTQSGGGVCTTVPQLGPTEAVALSPNSQQLYLTHSNGIVTFARNTTTGTLAFRGCINDAGNLGCSNGRNVSGMIYMAVSPDGEDLVAVNSAFPGAGGMAIFARNLTTGSLAGRAFPDGCITPDGRGFDNGAFVNGLCRASAAVGDHGHVHFFGNGFIYAGFYDGSKIAAFRRDYYPVCVSRAVTVPRNRATTIPLTCSDRNGDAIARSIVQAPTAGVLGAINQGAGSVFYNPFSGFSGSDHFTFRATAAGLAGSPAAISITIPAPPPKPPKRIHVDLSFSFDAFSDHTVFTRLQVKRVPRRAKVTATCRYKKHKCAGKAKKAFVKKRARGTVSLAKRFVGVDLKVGSKITVLVTKKRMIGAAKIVTIRSRKEPKIITRCVPVGKKKPKRRC
jgi:DNA-binding beta-propeller fold protein YncE